MTTAPTRPALRYYGGKWLLAPHIIALFPAHRVYVEPFAGGASVLLRKPRAYAEVYNDLDGEIVNLFRVLRDPASAERLARMVEATPFARAEFQRSATKARDPIEQARRTLIRGYMGFGSAGATVCATGFRSNSRRSGTTPARDWHTFPMALRAVAERMRGVVIEHKDALSVMRDHDAPDTLFYVDPPYPMATRARGSARPERARYRHEMTDAQHAELLAALCELRGHVIVSGYPCALYDNALRTWRRHAFPSLADGGRPRTEIVWTSPNIRARGLFQ